MNQLQHGCCICHHLFAAMPQASLMAIAKAALVDGVDENAVVNQKLRRFIEGHQVIVQAVQGEHYGDWL